MNLISILSKPAKFIYGAKIEDKLAPRPWAMKTKRSSAAYKSMVYTFGDIDNVPNFVKNNGCPWAMVSSATILSLPVIFTVKQVAKPFGWVGSKIKQWVQAPPTKVVGIPISQAVTEIEDFVNGLDVDEAMIKNYWWNDSKDFITFDDEMCILDPDDRSYFDNISVYFDVDEKGVITLKECYAKDGGVIKHLHMKTSKPMEDQLKVMELLMFVYVTKHPDTWLKTFSDMVAPEPSENKLWVERKKESDKVIATKKRNEKICMAVTKFGQCVSTLLLNVVFLGSLFGLIFGIIQTITHAGAVGSWLWVALNVILKCIACLFVGVVVIGLVVFLFQTLDEKGYIAKFFGTIWYPFGLVCCGIGTVFKTLFLSFKNECPINEFED